MGVIRWAWRIALAALVLLAATAAGVVLAHFATRGSQPTPRSLASVRVVLVLGSGLRPDGSLTRASRNRLERALALTRGAGDVWLICSGGLVFTARRLHAAAVMRDRAVALGFPADRVVAEPHSRSTLENLAYSLPLALELGAAPDNASLMIVTDTTHAPRARTLAWVLGWPNVAVATANTFDTLSTRARGRWILRETLAIWWNLAKVVVWKALGLAGFAPGERLEYVH